MYVTMNGLSNTTICSMNVNGLGSKQKRAMMKTHCDSFKAHILVLVDTRLVENSARELENEWDNRLWKHSYAIQTGSGLSRGISIGIDKRASISVTDFLEIKQGNMAFLTIEKDNQSICLSCIYGPSDRDRPGFFQRLFYELALINSNFQIVVGDFNVALNHDQDTLNYVDIRRPNARKMLHDKMAEGGFVDIFRHRNPTLRSYTWECMGNDKKSRIDYFLVTNNLEKFVTETTIGNLYASDHRIIKLSIDFTGFMCGKPKWRYRPSLNEDDQLFRKVTREIQNSCMRYVQIDGVPNFYECADFGAINEFRSLPLNSLADLRYTISYSALLEVIINDVKTTCISHEAGLSCKVKKEMESLQNRISHEESQDIRDNIAISALQEQYEALLHKCVTEELKGKKEKLKVEGEKPSSFFLNLEKHISSDRYIPCIQVNGTLEKSQDKIESHIRNFYEDLYANKDEFLSDITIEQYIGREASLECPKLNEVDKDSLENPITLEEITAILAKTKDKSAPGISGMSYAFFKKHWAFFGPLLIKVYDESFARGTLPQFFSRGAISLLPKPNKDKTLLNNWRPITLLECCYKILSATLAARINTVICKIVHNSQKGFIPGRNIVENVRLMYDTFHYAKTNKKGGTALVLDYEKAFDSISHKYFSEVLRFFNFGNNMRKWVRMCLADFQAHTVHANNLSEAFAVERGARQGDGLSPPLFALAIEIFSIKVRYNQAIKPFMLGDIPLKLSLYADDTVCYTVQDEDSIMAIIKDIQDFEGLSGLRIQMQKSSIVNFGVENSDLCPSLTLKREKKFSYLGYTFTPFLEDMDCNITDKLSEIEKAAKRWLYRFMSPLGRNIIAKCLLLPKVTHIFTAIPILCQKAISNLETAIFDFIWGGKKKRHAFNRNDSQCSFNDGGLEMPNIRVSIQSYLFSWFRRALREEENNPWRMHLDNLLVKACGTNLIGLLFEGNHIWQIAQGSIENPFWKNCFKFLKVFMGKFLQKFPHYIVRCPIWNCSTFKLGNKTLNPRSAENEEIAKKVNFAYEFLDEGGHLIPKSIMETKLSTIVPDPVYLTVSQKLSHYALLPGERYFVTYNPHIPIYAELFSLSSKGCSQWAKLIHRQRTPNIIANELKMAERFDILAGEERWKEAYHQNKMIKYGNNIRWLNCQIMRGSLATNRYLSKAKIKESDLCTFCKQESETIEHLFWSCRVVNSFLLQSNTELSLRGLDTDMLFITTNNFFKEIMLLGDNRPLIPPETPYLIDQLKRFIWICRCRNKLPNWPGLRNYLVREISIDKSLVLRNPELGFLGTLEDKIGIG